MSIGLSVAILLTLSSTASAGIHTLAVPEKFKETTYERYDTGDEATITLRDEGSGVFNVKGLALWERGSGSAHTGEIDGKVKMHKGVGHYSVGICKATLHLVKNELIVTDDNRQCDGMNVSFDGHYEIKK